ncbi:MAG: ankyrin repeat domain-containing protein [Hydrogenophilales bacterium]|nr:ankyrin repeat domain-containing protein [Hydrogenophilales bacterium]
MSIKRYLVLWALALVVACTSARAGSSEDLFAAIKANDGQEVERLLDAGADVSGKSKDGLTPLFWAAVWGADKAAELLVAHGAPVNGKSGREEFTPLHMAAYNLHKGVAELLISKGGDVNARSRSGWTPLHKAMEQLALRPATSAPEPSEVAKTVAMVALLLASGADANAKSEGGTMPIHSAALSCQRTLVEALIAKGADIDAKGPDDVTPLYLAAKKDCAEVAGLLVGRGAQVSVRTKSGFTPLLISAEEGNPDIAQFLLEHGADVNAKDKDGLTPLVWALKSLMLEYTLQASSPAAIEMRKKIGLSALERQREALGEIKGDFRNVSLFLINHGADLNIDVQGDTPIRMAALVGDVALVKAMIEKGADIKAIVRDANESPLHAAIAEGHREIAELLINNGADVNAENLSRRTPLHFLAAYLNDRKLAELMIEKGANVNAEDKDGRTPLSYATRAGNGEVADVLRQRGGK